jgi:hypothetical protein
MNNREIGFDHFVEAFFNNKNGTKMVLELTLDTNEDTTIYDIHSMLLQLFFIGLTKYEVAFGDMQNYFNNINIKLHVENFNIHQLSYASSYYHNRFLRVDSNMEMIKNGQHNETQINELKDVKSFYTIDEECNMCIYFDHMVC